MYCENCGAKIEDGARFCIACGTKIENDAPVVIEEPVVAPTEQEITKTPVVEQSEEPVPVEEQSVEEQLVVEPAVEQKPPKKKKKKWPIVLGIVVAVIAILVGVFFAFKDAVVYNTLKLMPADVQYKYIYNQVAKDVSKNIIDGIVSTRDMFNKEQTVEGVVEVQLNSNLLSILNQAAGTDLSAISEAKVNYKVTNNDGLTKVNLGVGNSKATILNTEICVDLKNQVFTMSIPELSSETVKVNIAELYSTGMGGNAAVMPEYSEDTSYSLNSRDLTEQVIISTIEELAEKSETLMPSNEFIEKMIPKYIGIIFEQIKDVERATVDVTVSGVTQKVTKFTANIDEDTVKDMLIAVLEAVKEDQDIKDYFTTVFNEVSSILPVGLDDDADDYWDDICDVIDDVVEQVEDADFDKLEIEYITYANNKGDIVGIECQVYFDLSEVADIFIMKAEKGNNVGIEAKVEFSKLKICEIEGSGVKKKDKFTGEIDIEFTGIKFIELDFTDFDTESYLEGKPNGTVKIKINNLNTFIPTAGLGQYITDTNASIEFNFNSTDNSTETEMQIKALGINLGSIKFTVNVSEAENVSMPSNTTDNIEGWAQGFNLENIEENLKQAGVYEFLSGVLEQDYQTNEEENFGQVIQGDYSGVGQVIAKEQSGLILSGNEY